jgi:hypothetical protein
LGLHLFRLVEKSVEKIGPAKMDANTLQRDYFY